MTQRVESDVKPYCYLVTYCMAHFAHILHNKNSWKTAKLILKTLIINNEHSELK